MQKVPNRVDHMKTARRKNLKLARVSAFAQLGDETWDQLSNTTSRRYFGIDTVFTLDPRSDLVWDWIRCRQQSNVSSATMRLGEFSFPHRIHRLVLARSPMTIENRFQRSAFQNRLRMFLHMHMRDGAVVYVVFLSSTWQQWALIQTTMNFAFLCDARAPRVGQLYRLPKLWWDSFDSMQDVTEGRRALEYCQSALEAVRSQGSLAVWYEPEMFTPRSRPSQTVLWNNFRRLVYDIQGGFCQGPSCGRWTGFQDGQVDHIMALRGQRGGNSLLPNLAWLCEPCNKRKSSIETFESPFESALRHLPAGLDDSRTREAFGNSSPVWLANFKKRPTPITTTLDL